MRHQQFNLALQRARGNRHVKIGLAQISIPLRNLVFKNAVVPECIPRQPANLAMVLMRIVSVMRENDIGIDARL